MSWFCIFIFFFWTFFLTISFADRNILQYSLCKRKLIYMLSRFTYEDLIFIPDSAAYILVSNAFDKSQRSVERNCRSKNARIIKCSSYNNGEHIHKVNLASLELLQFSHQCICLVYFSYINHLLGPINLKYFKKEPALLYHNNIENKVLYMFQ